LFYEFPAADIEGDSLFLVFREDRLLVKRDAGGCGFVGFADIAESIKDMDPGTVHFAGSGNGVGHYCFQARSPFKMEKPGFEFLDLRSLMVLLDGAQFALACTASQVLYWDRTTKFCGECGAETRYSQSERARTCPECGRTFYPAITPAIIVAVMNEGKILLAHNRNFAEGVYSLIAGFVEPGESLEECVRREVFEETGVAAGDVKYFKSQPWPFPSSMMIGFSASYESGEIKPDGVEIEDARWFGRDDLPKLPRPGSLSRKIIDAMMKA